MDVALIRQSLIKASCGCPPSSRALGRERPQPCSLSLPKTKVSSNFAVCYIFRTTRARLTNQITVIGVDSLRPPCIDGRQSYGNCLHLNRSEVKNSGLELLVCAQFLSLLYRCFLTQARLLKSSYLSLHFATVVWWALPCTGMDWKCKLYMFSFPVFHFSERMEGNLCTVLYFMWLQKDLLTKIEEK